MLIMTPQEIAVELLVRTERWVVRFLMGLPERSLEMVGLEGGRVEGPKGTR